ncbi:MAG: hypothetical protein KZQ56_12125 [gamma proteobacterium symbiont of Lucinoma myriamae]|nr:hypothetical protein [gamma proteobacterium symbiont of Lucinoma myriamae]MCU7833304.1 hypothetical protein [gamma proteobacterium symbiont of Lucinoma myriamae]
MKTIKTLLTATLFASVAISGTVQADNSLASAIYEDSLNIYDAVNHQNSTKTEILSYGDNSNQTSVWSTKYEQYVNPADFQQADIASIGDINRHISSNPAAAGKNSGNIFIYNETAGEYHLQ